MRELTRNPSPALGRARTQDVLPAGSRSARRLRAGLALIVIGVPLVFLPLSQAPFADPKLALLLVGVLFVWSARLPVDRELALPATLWFTVAAVGSLLGVDRWTSILGPQNQASGLILLGASAFLLVAGVSLPRELSERLPRWVVGAATLTALGVPLLRFAPKAATILHPPIAIGLGSTLGQQVLVAGFVAAGIACVPALSSLRDRHVVAIMTVLATALALVAERSGWLAAAVGLAISLSLSRTPRRRAMLIAGTLVLVTLAWTAVDAWVRPAVPLSATRAFGALGEISARGHLAVFLASLRAWARRPILGWGPGNLWSGYLVSATKHQVSIAGRGWGDAHNILAETAATTGAAGFATLLFLGVRTVSRIVRRPLVGWAAGAAAALFVLHLLQPLSVSLTPLLFLLAGVAAAPGGVRIANRPAELDAPAESFALRRGGRALSGGLLICGLALALWVAIASTFEAYGRAYGSEGALRASVAVQPGRISATDALAISLAVDARAGDAAAAREARALAAAAVREHPWNPEVRLSAADVELLLGDRARARAWIERQLDRFPADDVPLPGDAPPGP